MDWQSGTTGARRMACAVRPVATEPASATTIAEVEAVYVWALCETRSAQPSGTLLPIAVHLKPVARVEMPSDGDWDNGRVKEMFPERLHDDLLSDGLTNKEVAELETAVRARARELAVHQ